MHEWSLHVRYSWRAWLGGHGFPPANIKMKKNTQLLLLWVYCCCYSCHYCCFSCFNVLERWPFDTIFLRPEPLYNVSDSVVMVLLSWVTTWGQYTAPFSPPQQATVCKLHVKKNQFTWTYLSSSNKMQRNCMGLKITLCIQLGTNSEHKVQRD